MPGEISKKEKIWRCCLISFDAQAYISHKYRAPLWSDNTDKKYA